MFQVKHVINYDFPVYMADYIHRCGRTGRVGSVEGCHVSNFIATLREVELVQKIEVCDFNCYICFVHLHKVHPDYF